MFIECYYVVHHIIFKYEWVPLLLYLNCNLKPDIKCVGLNLYYIVIYSLTLNLHVLIC